MELKKVIKYLVMSDVHLGHPTNHTSFIVSNIYTMLDIDNPNSVYCSLDAIFIAGDLFHTNLELSDTTVFDIMLFAHRLFTFLEKNDIALYILEGTASHDWKQSRLLAALHETKHYNFEFRYVKDIDILYLPKLDRHVLFVPDLEPKPASEIYTVVQQKLHELNLDKVDIAIMHGMFTYQAKMIPNKNACHDEHSYLDIVRGCIHIGHIHTFSYYQRIFAQGSTDRLAQGEEEAKGFMVFIDRGNGDFEYQFIENKNARIFKTIKIKDDDLDTVFKKLDKAIGKYPHDSFIRILAKKDHPIYPSFKQVKLRYPFYFLKLDNLEKENSKKHLISEAIKVETIFEPIVIDEVNIVNLITNNLLAQSAISNEDISELRQILEELK